MTSRAHSKQDWMPYGIALPPVTPAGIVPLQVVHCEPNAPGCADYYIWRRVFWDEFLGVSGADCGQVSSW